MRERLKPATRSSRYSTDTIFWYFSGSDDCAMKEILGCRKHSIRNESDSTIEARRDDETRTLITTVAPGGIAVFKVSGDKPIVLANKKPKDRDALPLRLEEYCD